jgi:hypothetical protein
VTDAGRCEAFINYAAPATSDNCNTMTSFLQSSYPSKRFPPGTHNETWVVFDAMPSINTLNFNVAQCIFSVTVTDNEKPNLGKCTISS